jgi:DNA-binding transcriptional regulator GbsR (MarR family)
MGIKHVIKTSGRSDKKTIFKIEKDFSINNITHVKKELDEIVNKNKSFHLELTNLENFDLSSIQLLQSIKNKLLNDFSYTIHVKEEIKTIIKHSGFENLLNK